MDTSGFARTRGAKRFNPIGVMAQAMAGVSAIISVVALLVGLAAIWLVTESVKKIENRTLKMVDVHLRGLRKSVVDLASAVSEIKAGQEETRNRVRDVVRNRETADVEISSLRREIDALGKSQNQKAILRSGKM